MIMNHALQLLLSFACVALLYACSNSQQVPHITETGKVPWAGLFVLAVLMFCFLYAWKKFNEKI